MSGITIDEKLLMESIDGTSLPYRLLGDYDPRTKHQNPSVKDTLIQCVQKGWVSKNKKKKGFEDTYTLTQLGQTRLWEAWQFGVKNA